MDFKTAWQQQQIKSLHHNLYGHVTASRKTAREIARETKLAADNRADTAVKMKAAVTELDELIHNLQAIAAGSWRRNGGQ